MIEIDKLTKRYGEFVALAEFSLEVGKGEFVSLLGPSGSGKTTLLNLIAGMTRPSSGRIVIDGVDVTDLPASKRDLGMVFQNYALMPHMTVFENIAFPLRVRRVPNAEIKRRVGEVLDLIRMPHVAERRPRELSGGQQQRISLARCIVYRPSLILMDEPLGALDKKLREEMQIEISRLHRESGITMLYVTHDQEEALTMSDRIVLMREGRCAQVGTADELYFNPVSPYVADFIGHSNQLTCTILREEGGNVVVGLAGGDRRAVPRPAFPVPVGGKAILLVRPESASLAARADDHHSLRGTLEASLVVGSNIKHVVRLDSGETFLVQELNHRLRARPAIGSAVWVGWSAEASQLLSAS
ncbi:ABC transporter ATP-binding protein [Azospirillum oleiclasticum]|nr:ABC transporter ATP-binding protein [Azospirillum oleiclasticum]